MRVEGHRIETSRYILEFEPSEALATLRARNSGRTYLFFPGGACNPPGRRDETRRLRRISIQRLPDGAVRVRVVADSSCWKSRVSFYLCREDSVEILHEITGAGRLDQVLFLRGYLNGEERGMCGEFDEIFSTAPNFQEKQFFHPGESFGISAGDHIPMPVGAQALASPCYCVGLHDRRDSEYVSVGAACAPGEYTWDAFQWNPAVKLPVTPTDCDNTLAGGFALSYAGKQSVRGRWQSPRLVLTFADAREEVLCKFLAHCFARGFLERPPQRTAPGWWKEPIYCTWHDQAGRAASQVGYDPVKISKASFDFCNQELCERWIRLLIRKDCRPGIVILDATWAVHLNSGQPDPRKWSDMRAWIESCHRRGIRVFVWALAWSTEGLPQEECITRNGEPVACDITHPAYLRRFRAMIRHWFSDAPDCLNADGVKLDGQLGLPTGANLKSHGGVWGLELQRLYLKELHTEAKAHKPDACVSAFSLHPLLAEFTDMVRLGDMYTHRPTTREAMRARAEVFRVCQPHAVLDTDGQMRFDVMRDCAEILEEQSRLGAPTLYNAEWEFRAHFFQPASLKKFQAKDYKDFAKVLNAYRKKLYSESPCV